jgi:hypothetical protein
VRTRGSVSSFDGVVGVSFAWQGSSMVPQPTGPGRRVGRALGRGSGGAS